MTGIILTPFLTKQLDFFHISQRSYFDFEKMFMQIDHELFTMQRPILTEKFNRDAPSKKSFLTCVIRKTFGIQLSNQCLGCP
jgi:hypothetical protein